MIRYSYFTMAPFKFYDNYEFYGFYKKFDEIIRDERFTYQYKMKPGDYVIYNNHKTLHARESFKGDRHLRYYNKYLKKGEFIWMKKKFLNS
jgi:alpha-ketoglutarate-dependent taurine dioxygenase